MILDLVLGAAIGLLAFNILATAAVLALYLRAYLTAPVGARLLPLHVWLVSTGYVCHAVGGIIGMRDGPLAWRAGLYLVGSVLVLAALVVIARRGARLGAATHRGMSGLPILTVPRNPVEAWVGWLCLTAGVGLLVSGAQPDSIEALLHPVVRVAWAVALTAGGAGVLLGTLWPDRTRGVEMLRAGWVAIAVMLTVYLLASITDANPGVPTVASLAVTVPFVAAAGARVWQATRWLALK